MKWICQKTVIKKGTFFPVVDLLTSSPRVKKDQEKSQFKPQQRSVILFKMIREKSHNTLSLFPLGGERAGPGQMAAVPDGPGGDFTAGHRPVFPQPAPRQLPRPPQADGRLGGGRRGRPSASVTP